MKYGIKKAGTEKPGARNPDFNRTIFSAVFFLPRSLQIVAKWHSLVNRMTFPHSRFVFSSSLLL
jgi:hypothetical protein